MYHRLQRLPLSRTLESPTPECFLPVQIRMPQRRQREQAPVPVQIRVLRLCRRRARAQYSTRYRTPPIELREGHGIDGASTVNAEMQMWAGGATGVTRCPDLVAYLDVLPHTDHVSEGGPSESGSHCPLPTGCTFHIHPDHWVRQQKSCPMWARGARCRR